MAVSLRHKFNARNAQRPKDERAEYEIVDPNHQPAMDNKLGGVEIYKSGGKSRMRLTDAQARFFLDQGVIKAVETE